MVHRILHWYWSIVTSIVSSERRHYGSTISCMLGILFYKRKMIIFFFGFYCLLSSKTKYARPGTLKYTKDVSLKLLALLCLIFILEVHLSYLLNSVWAAKAATPKIGIAFMVLAGSQHMLSKKELCRNSWIVKENCLNV